MLCTRCRHDNPEENRYCGMCGERLESAQAPRKEEVPEPRSSESMEPAIGSIFGLNSALHPGDTRRPEPPISGPSFLGLNSGAESSGTSYLFDDEPSGGHAGTWITLLLLLAVAVAGFHFRGQVRARGDQIYTALMERVNPRPAPPAPAPAPSMVSVAPSSDTSPSASAPSEDLLKDAKAPNSAASPKLDVQPTPATATEQKSDESKGKDPPAAEKSARRVSSNATDEETAVTPTRATGKSIGRHPTPSPDGVPSPDDMRLLQLAQKYIHGQGVRRDCQQGLNYLRGAMKHANAPAASQMGALYATGTCVSQDRVAAYRWFSSALQMAPSNPWLARERDQIYAQMTTSERHRADRQ